MKLTSSPKLNSLLYEMGIHSYYGVISHLPRKYEYFVATTKEELANLVDKQRVVLEGKIEGNIRTLRFSSSNNASFYFHNDEDNEDYEIIAWNRPYLGKETFGDDKIILSCIYDKKRHKMNMVSFKKVSSLSSRIVPVYSLPSDYPPHLFNSLVKKSLKEEQGKIFDQIPAYFRSKYRLISKEEALNKVHCPLNNEDIRQGLRVLKYEEALEFSLHNLLIREENASLRKSKNKDIDINKLDSFISSLPFKLTLDQENAVKTIEKDMCGPNLMYRLLQGDVGTGKTLVALIATYINYLRNSQTALMAPTSSLAKQHFDYFSSLLRPLGIKIALLTGSVKGKERNELLERIKNNEVDIIIGTHALFSKDVIYPNLGFVIIDEQHKFGVNQRSLLASKGDEADLLLMSATPIPRTLALTLYGDLDVSTISTFPFSNRDVKTVL
ncbi:MAG: DEAD/DEAH box helicase, partial [Mollicutes bacterium]|nr:DEAD/DEAH box helicase [Mollicutes bacterium]